MNWLRKLIKNVLSNPPYKPKGHYNLPYTFEIDEKFKIMGEPFTFVGFRYAIFKDNEGRMALGRLFVNDWIGVAKAREDNAGTYFVWWRYEYYTFYILYVHWDGERWRYIGFNIPGEHANDKEGEWIERIRNEVKDWKNKIK